MNCELTSLLTFQNQKKMAEDDFNLALSPVRKSAPRRGRRATEDQSQHEAFGESSKIVLDGSLRARRLSGELVLDDDHAQARPPPPTHGRRTGGWADETSRSKTAKSVRILAGPPEDIGRIGGGSSEEDEPVIPDLDDVQDEDMALQVAEAPAVSVNRVATYRELDNDLLKHVAFATMEDIDLRLLTRCLAPESSLKEPDVTWHWDQVFAQVSGELRREWFPDEEVDETATEEEQKTRRERPYTAFNRFPV